MKSLAATIVLALAAAGSAHAADLERVYAGPKAPFASVIAVPASAQLVFFSGAIAPPLAAAGPDDPLRTTAGQTEAILKGLGERLTTEGLTYADVVSAHVFLAGDPAKGGKMDFAGMNGAYAKVFGSPSQPERPTRSAMQVAALAVPGALVEIEIVAARTRPR